MYVRVSHAITRTIYNKRVRGLWSFLGAYSCTGDLHLNLRCNHYTFVTLNFIIHMQDRACAYHDAEQGQMFSFIARGGVLFCAFYNCLAHVNFLREFLS